MKKKKIVITEWDKKLFIYLHQRKVALLEQIQRDLPKYKNIISLNRRIYTLKKGGYLKVNYSADHPKKIVLSITKKGFSDYINYGDCNRRELGSSKIEHDLALVDIRFILLRSEGISKYLSENEFLSFDTYYKNTELKSFILLRSDAVIQYEVNKTSKKKYWLSVEYEASKKTLNRYHDLLKHYYSAVDIPLVIYICASEQIKNMVARVEKRVKPSKQPFKFYYTILDELKQDPFLRFTTQEGKVLSLIHDTS